MLGPEWADYAEAAAWKKPNDGVREAFLAFLGKPVAVWCPRHVYRGTVDGVENGVLSLGNAFVVDITGKADQEKAISEYPVPGGVFVPLAAIEMLCQPRWASR